MEPLAPSAPALCGSRRFENATESDNREGECGHQKETLQQRELPPGFENESQHLRLIRVAVAKWSGDAGVEVHPVTEVP